jgi:error-prone DNA polymerase
MYEPPPFVDELHCRSNFTFLVGASQPEEMVERAAAKLYSALALTDECSVSGVVRAPGGWTGRWCVHAPAQRPR